MTRSGRNFLLLTALTAFCGSLGPAMVDAADASDRLIRRCSAEGSVDISMSAKYEVRSDRKKFSVELEAAPGGALRRGQAVAFFVAGKNVGSDRLQTIVGGDLVGEINLDTRAGPRDTEEKPFPPNFPAVGLGTKVVIKSGGKVLLGCSLR
jgi:hypothetical protein